MICYNNIKKERKSNLKGVIRTTQHNTTERYNTLWIILNCFP